MENTSVMSLIKQSFQRLFPDKEFSYQTEMEYNRRLKDFNANIHFHRNKIKVNLNLQWKDIDDEIKIGLIQFLLLKIFKKKTSTPNINLYNNFVKNIPTLTPKTNIDPELELSFERMNQLFLNEELEKPNLIWGRKTFRKLAHYNFHDDSITVSETFRDSPQHIIDYLMYHEMLHKHFKFTNKNGRASYHSKEFKQAEAEYPNQKAVEEEITQIIRSKKRKTKKNLWRWI
jgi:predicted metal-dependent hydrolase